MFIGALIIYFTKSKGRNVALINWVVTLIALVPTFVFILHCPTLELVGVTVDYPNTPGCICLSVCLDSVYLKSVAPTVL